MSRKLRRLASVAFPAVDGGGGRLVSVKCAAYSHPGNPYVHDNRIAHVIRAYRSLEGIPDDKAKAIAKKIRAEGPKGVQAQIQGDQLRVSGKKRDDLQEAIALIRTLKIEQPLQFVNFRD